MNKSKKLALIAFVLSAAECLKSVVDSQNNIINNSFLPGDKKVSPEEKIKWIKLLYDLSKKEVDLVKKEKNTLLLKINCLLRENERLQHSFLNKNSKKTVTLDEYRKCLETLYYMTNKWKMKQIEKESNILKGQYVQLLQKSNVQLVQINQLSRKNKQLEYNLFCAQKVLAETLYCFIVI